MCKEIFISIFCLASAFSYSQSHDLWTTYEDKQTGLYGFADNKGELKVNAKYLMVQAKMFSDIAAVIEEDNTGYYLLKNGSRIGIDSLYIFDSAFDCESEGFIRFQDKNGKIGMFNKQGKAVIPAEYDELTPVHNGLTTGLKGAVKEYLDDDKEHWGWKGGKWYLLNEENKVLVEGFSNDLPLDYHSLKIENTPSEDSSKESYQGINGKYYTFYNNKKLFEYWLSNDFLKFIDNQSIFRNSNSQIIYWNDENGWSSRDSRDFIEDNYELIRKRISNIVEGTDYFITIEDFIILTDTLRIEFQQYMNNCGELKTSQYPVFDVVVNHKMEDEFYQDHFGFLKTENGFKLLNISIQNANLK